MMKTTYSLNFVSAADRMSSHKTDEERIIFRTLFSGNKNFR